MFSDSVNIDRNYLSRGMGYLSLGVTLACLTACTKAIREWPAIHGQVLDTETEQPIEGAAVVGNWDGMMSYSNTRCFHIERDITDERGRFSLPEWINNNSATARSAYQSISMHVHKYGYRESEKTHKTQSYRKNIYYLERDVSTASDRLKYLSALIINIACSDQDKKIKLFPIEKAIYLEATELAETEEDMKHLGYIRYSIVQSWVPVDVWGTLKSGDAYNNYFEKHVKEEFLSADY